MENEKVFKYSFKLVFSCPPYFSPVRLPGIKFIYRTEEIQNPTTTEEIFKSSQSFLRQTIEKYNNYKIKGETTILTTYRLYIVWKVEKDESEQPKEKDLYGAIYQIEEGNKIRVEEKKSVTLSETIHPNFYIFVVPTVYIFRERQPYPYGEENKEYQNPLKIAECTICLKNPTNVLFTRCYHIVVCDICNQSNKIRYCPLCKNSLGKTKRIKI